MNSYEQKINDLLTDLEHRKQVYIAVKNKENVQVKLKNMEDTHWLNCNEPTFAWDIYDYRIAPNPPVQQEFWLNIYSQNITTHTSKQKALNAANKYTLQTSLHVKEVRELTHGQ